jgi:hypothetical protein
MVVIQLAGFRFSTTPVYVFNDRFPDIAEGQIAVKDD